MSVILTYLYSIVESFSIFEKCYEEEEEEPSRPKPNVLPQYIAALSANVGSFACGLCIGWTTLNQHEIKDGAFGFKVTDDEFLWITWMFNLGAAFFCIPIGFLIKNIGCKWSMLFVIIPFTCGWILIIISPNFQLLCIARFLLGISGGAFCIACPIYTGEIASKEVRGIFGVFFQLLLVFGQLIAYILACCLNVKTISIICGLVPLVFGIIFIFMPQTPTYFVRKAKYDNAVKSMKWLRGSDYIPETELSILKEEDQKNNNSVSICTALKRPVTVKSICVSVGLMSFQQFSGINAVLFYAEDIFHESNLHLSTESITVIVGIIQVVSVFISTFIVDRLGRRFMLLLSGISMLVSTITLGIYYLLQYLDKSYVKAIGFLPLICFCIFIITFSFGYGPIPWLMIGEIFPSDIKGPAGSIAGTYNWLLSFSITCLINMKEIFGPSHIFWIFSFFSLLGLFFAIYLVPETKGKSLKVIQDELEHWKLRKN